MRAVDKVFLVVMALQAGVGVAQPSAGFREDFNAMTVSNLVTHSGLLTCGRNPGGDDPENLTMTVPGTNTWGFLASSVYSLTWQGTGATQSWAVNGGVLYTHAQKGLSDDGHAFLSRRSFDRNRYLTATIRMAPDYCQSSSGGCFAGFTLIASEADYREIAFWSTGTVDAFGRQLYRVGRWAPCDARDFYDANGQPIVVPGGTLYSLRLDYLGPEGGGWRYFFNGAEVKMVDANGALKYGEAGTSWKAALRGDPHVGMYWAAPGVGQYFEGRMDEVVVHQLDKVTPLSVYAKSSYMGTPPSSATDGDPSTQWNAGVGAPSWIEFDLGSTLELKKLRLLTSQWPSGTTTHNIYVGNAPAPTTLVKRLQGSTTDNTWLDVDLIGAGVSGRYVRVETTVSPGWVAWREIQLYR
ncbi:discoidin domain-containing protein [Archangium sp.]|uniref:discoidin domain-containing protein n=1 Tax=Archangium sp. TaxID=1872627 RepID=UPI00286BFE94|nr:discoidin domain-containing protein [Archangium sp.]